MIATILPSSTTFHAVDYNERKVSEGVAELLEMKGFDLIDQNYTPEDLKQAFIDYTYQYNDRIQKPQFHLAISCRGNEYTHEQLLEIAHKYLDEMGYGDPNQPVLIYAHHDTDNNHLHIVTSRVAPDGHKIDHNQERIRSQEVINRIMGENQEQRASDAVKKALDYRFSTISQFKAILRNPAAMSATRRMTVSASSATATSSTPCRWPLSSRTCNPSSQTRSDADSSAPS